MPKMSWILVSALVVLLPICVSADTTGQTNWSLLPSGGTYSWDGKSTDGLVGSDIGVASVSSIGTSSHNGGTAGILFGSLDFTSGAYDGNGSNWSWGAGGVLNVTGCIAGVTSTACTGSNNVTLLSDDFTSVSIVPVLQLGILSFDVVFGNLTGNLNSMVASYFGLSTSFSATSLNLILTTSTPGKALNGINIGGKITATSTVAVSEEWGLGSMLMLFGIVFAGFGLARRFGMKPIAY